MLISWPKRYAGVPPRQDGAAASEYAISLAFIVVAIALAASQFDLTEVFPALAAKISGLIK